MCGDDAHVLGDAPILDAAQTMDAVHVLDAAQTMDAVHVLDVAHDHFFHTFLSPIRYRILDTNIE